MSCCLNFMRATQTVGFFKYEPIEISVDRHVWNGSCLSPILCQNDKAKLAPAHELESGVNGEIAILNLFGHSSFDIFAIVKVIVKDEPGWGHIPNFEVSCEGEGEFFKYCDWILCIYRGVLFRQRRANNWIMLNSVLLRPQRKVSGFKTCDLTNESYWAILMWCCF